MRSQALDRAAGRIVWIRLAGLLIVLVLAGRAAHLSVAHTRARDLYERRAKAKGEEFDESKVVEPYVYYQIDGIGAVVRTAE